MKSVYIETSIPSFYHESRQEPEMVARRHWTRQWWGQCSGRYHLLTSEGVIAELQEGKYETQVEAIGLMQNVPRLDVVDDIANIIDVYLANHLMPKERLGLFVPALVTPMELFEEDTP